MVSQEAAATTDKPEEEEEPPPSIYKAAISIKMYFHFLPLHIDYRSVGPIYRLGQYRLLNIRAVLDHVAGQAECNSLTQCHRHPPHACAKTRRDVQNVKNSSTGAEENRLPKKPNTCDVPRVWRDHHVVAAPSGFACFIITAFYVCNISILIKMC